MSSINQLKKASADIIKQQNIIVDELARLRSQLRKDKADAGLQIKIEQIEKDIRKMSHPINELTKIAIRSKRSAEQEVQKAKQTANNNAR